MGNAQEAIEEYEHRVSSARRLDTTDKRVVEFLDHEYADNGDCSYLARRQDGVQRWINPPKDHHPGWIELEEAYWARQVDSQYDTPEDEP